MNKNTESAEFIPIRCRNPWCNKPLKTEAGRSSHERTCKPPDSTSKVPVAGPSKRSSKRKAPAAPKVESVSEIPKSSNLGSTLADASPILMEIDEPMPPINSVATPDPLLLPQANLYVSIPTIRSELDIGQINFVLPKAYIGFMNLLVNTPTISETVGNRLLHFMKGNFKDASDTLPASVKEGYENVNKYAPQPLLERGTVALNGRSYAFKHHNILDTALCIIQTGDNLRNYLKKERMSLTALPPDAKYGNICNAEWWRKVESSLSPRSYLLPLFLYGDGTAVDHSSREEYHPIYVSVASTDQYKIENRRLLAEIPVDSTLSADDKKKVFHLVLNVILKPLLETQDRGILWKISSKTPVNSHSIQDAIKNGIFVVPRLAGIIGDLLEQATFLCALGHNSDHPCLYCLVKRKNIMLPSPSPIREISSTKDLTAAEARGMLSMLKIDSSLSQLRDFSCANFFIDRLHTWDCGLWKATINGVLDKIKSYRRHGPILQTLQQRFETIPRYRNRRLPESIIALGNYHGREYAQIATIMPFVFDGLLNSDDMDGFMDVYNPMMRSYQLCRKTALTEFELAQLDETSKEAMQKWALFFDSDRIKSHNVMHHLTSQIRLFGVLDYVSCELWENFHIHAVKRFYQHQTNKKSNWTFRIFDLNQRKAFNNFTNAAAIPKPLVAVNHLLKGLIFKLNIPPDEWLIPRTLNCSEFEKALQQLRIFTTSMALDGATISLYKSYIIDQGRDDRIFATPDYYGSPFFSSVVINVSESREEDLDVDDNGTAMARVLAIAGVVANGSETQYAVVQWYSFVELDPGSDRTKLGCPYMRLSARVGVVELDTFVESADMIPSNTVQEHYYMNTYLFA